ncbi:serine protease 16 [Phyllostomus discolor]|uniref:Serine protease 16 n=1 Tax=Phyllostomus discolor TaxID=89673 RepID=A0A834DDB9_9CHIR|nr:serine protease 16 [Phyllostomus discolor]
MAVGPALWLSPLLLVSLCGSSAPASLLRRLGAHVRRVQESSVLRLSLDPGTTTLPKEGWLEQPLDPFNASDRRSFLQVVLHSLGQRCLSVSRAETLAQLRVTEPQVSRVGDRQWLYQTCTEFGFYVTCQGPRCPFSQLPALPSQLELCEKVFGLSTSSMVQAVTQTNSYYGGQTPGATQVLFVNGDADPWHVLSVTQALGPSVSALLIPSASHCSDMAPESPSDTPSLRQGRQSIFQQLQTWLRLAKRSPLRGGL